VGGLYAWRAPRVGLDAVEWVARVEKLGAGEILLTSMDRDGTKDGYDIELMRTVSDNVRIPVIASGGAGRPEHFHEALNRGRGQRGTGCLAVSLWRIQDCGCEKNICASEECW